MAAGDEPRQGKRRADDAAGEVEEIRRSLARGGRPRVGRRFDAVIQTARASRPELPPERRRRRQDQLPRWEGPDEQAEDQHADDDVDDAHAEDEHAAEESGDAVTDAPTADAPTADAPTADAAGEPPATGAPPESIPGSAPTAPLPLDVPQATVVETTGEGILRPDELAALRAGARPPTPGAGDRVGIAWPPHAAVAFLIAVIALIAFGVGMAIGGLQRPASSSAPPQTAVAPTVPAPTAAAANPPLTVTVTVPAPPPAACLETARLGDQTIALLTANIRDRRLDEALRRYAAASQACRRAASQNR